MGMYENDEEQNCENECLARANLAEKTGETVCDNSNTLFIV